MNEDGALEALEEAIERNEMQAAMFEDALGQLVDDKWGLAALSDAGLAQAISKLQRERVRRDHGGKTG